MKGRAYPLLLAPAAAVALAVAAPFSSPAHAQVDISGDWTITVSGDESTTCGVTFGQSGNSLSADLECLGGVSGVLSGSINPESGVFSLEGILGPGNFNFDGTVEQSGDRLSGTWEAASFGISGTFEGNRGTFVEQPISTPLSCPVGLSSPPCIAYGPGTGAGPGAWSHHGETNAVAALIAAIGVVVVGAGAFVFRGRGS